MADLQRTIGIIFDAETGSAQQSIDSLEKSIDALDNDLSTLGADTGSLDAVTTELDQVDSEASNAQTAVDSLDTSLGDLGGDVSGISTTTKGIDELGKESGTTGASITDLGDRLKKLAEDVGMPTEALDRVTGILSKIGGAGGGLAVAAAGAIVALGTVIVSTGDKAREFSGVLTNVSGGAIDTDKAFKFVVDTAKALEEDIDGLIGAYQTFLVKLEGTGVSSVTAENAFRGIAAAVDAAGGGTEEINTALAAFSKIAKDGEIKAGELDRQIGTIPGGLRIFAEALGVSADQLRTLANEGRLGKEEIDLFAKALSEQTYAVDLEPVNSAFNDLMNTIKQFAIDIGSGGIVSGGLDIFAKLIRGVTVLVAGSIETFKAFGATLANVAYTITSGDFGGFLERQSEIGKTFSENIQGAIDKFVGLEEQVKAADATPASDSYAKLADQLKAAGDKAGETSDSTNKLSSSTSEAKKQSDALAAAEKEKARELAASAAAAAKAEEAARQYALEMEKIASNERIKLIEAKVQIDIANIEATTQRIQANFESLDNTINSTGDVIKETLGLLTQAPDWYTFDILKSQLDTENQLRREAFELQKALTQAQIENLDAQTANLKAGDALIKINGDGLQPHLEAFMWEILKAVQVKVNSQGLKLLLGA